MRAMLPTVSMECTAVADPELRFASSGTAVATIRTASNKRKQDESGQWVDSKVCYLRVSCFGRLAENVAESVVKGDKLVITGTLQTDEWNDKDTGEKRSSIECTAWTVAVSLAFRTVKHGEGRAERVTSPPSDQWGTPPPQEEPPF